MKVLFSHAYFLEEDPKEKRIMKPYPPLGILSVSAWLEKCGFPNEVLDSTFITKDVWKKEVRRIQPDVLALYANLITKIRLIELVKWVRGTFPATKIVLGGPDVTYNIQNYLNCGIDVVIIGEGEVSMLDLMQAYTNPSSDLRAIPGLAFLQKDGTMHKTAARQKIKDLNCLPVPSRNKIDLDKYLEVWKEHHGHSSISISTQRGCPYTCKWCSTAVYGQSYRRRSAKHVVDEIAYLQGHYPAHKIWFVDDVFTVSHKWLSSFEDALKEENISISFECITRADRLNEQVLDTLKRMGCFRIWIGAESGSQDVLNLMDRRVDVLKVRDMIIGTRQRDMEAGTFIMLGYPGETESDIKQTLQHLKSAAPDHFTITVAYPIKGTALYKEVAGHITKPSPWSEHTDRELDYRRNYSHRYYHYAVRWLTNSVRFNQQLKSNLLISRSTRDLSIKNWFIKIWNVLVSESKRMIIWVNLRKDTWTVEQKKEDYIRMR